MKYHLLFLCLVVWACADNGTDNDLTKSQKSRVHNDALFTNSLTLDFGVNESIVNTKSQKIQFEIVSDSRCPSSLVCIWGGEVTVQITILDSQVKPITFILKPGESKVVRIDGKLYDVKLVTVEPYPVDGPIPADDYRIVLQITPA